TDAGDLSLRLITALSEKFGDHPAIEVARSTYLPLQLAYLGRFRDAYAAHGDRPTPLYAELVWLNAVPAEAARATYARALHDNPFGPRSPLPSGARSALPFWARVGDTASIAAVARAFAQADGGLSGQSARCTRASAQAYLSLARRDSAHAAAQFRALSDTLCVHCQVDRMVASQLLEARGSTDDARRLLGARLPVLLSPLEVWGAAERGRLLEGSEADRDRDRAIAGYRVVAGAWSRGDPAARNMAAAGAAALKRLRRPQVPEISRRNFPRR
ncbi:MAG: hypothetical protein H0X11_09550, partial [Betaproteobacteria bacterium]|nr:hypothetical protein [Betaproteobacteria bacterium]